MKYFKFNLEWKDENGTIHSGWSVHLAENAEHARKRCIEIFMKRHGKLPEKVDQDEIYPCY